MKKSLPQNDCFAYMNLRTIQKKNENKILHSISYNLTKNFGRLIDLILFLIVSPLHNI